MHKITIFLFLWIVFNYCGCAHASIYNGNVALKSRANKKQTAICSKMNEAKRYPIMDSIRMLQEEGKLKILDQVCSHLPNFPYKNITIEDLLTHTSGLSIYFSLIEKYGDKNDSTTNYDVLNRLINHKLKLRFQPYSAYQFSNTGYVIFMLIIKLYLVNLVKSVFR